MSESGQIKCKWDGWSTCLCLYRKYFIINCENHPPLSVVRYQKPSPAPECDRRSKSPTQLTPCTQHSIIRIRIHITLLSIQRWLLYFVFLVVVFYLLWFSAAARIKCFTFHSPTVIHRSSSSNITLFIPLCIFIRCVTSMKSVWSFTFHNDSGVWRTQESEKKPFIFISSSCSLFKHVL